MTHLKKPKALSFLKWVSTVPVIKKHLRSSRSHLPHTSWGFCTFEAPVLKWVSTDFVEKHRRSSKSNIAYPSRGYSTEQVPGLKRVSRDFCEELLCGSRIKRKAQAALLDYLHCTRCLHFVDAEYMSKNSPAFLQKLLKRVGNQQDVRQSLSKFLLYHPINEFEPFFESLGLEESEVSQVLPRDSMFLSDNHLLVDNVHILCDYGVPRCSVGKMYMEEKEIFGYEHGVLGSMLQAYEDVGLSKTSVLKLLITSPSLLIEDVKRKFIEELEGLRSSGIECEWIARQLCRNNTYEWRRMFSVMHFFVEMGYSKEELGVLLIRHPELLLDSSGDRRMYSLIGLLLKMSSTMNDVKNLFLQLPQTQVGVFIENLRRSLKFLIEVGMRDEDIIKILHFHPRVLGSSRLKRPNTVLVKLNVGRKRLCKIIKEDPSQLRNWVFGSNISPLPKTSSHQWLLEKTALFTNLGFTEDSSEMKNALKKFRGRSSELQERFDCLVKAGLDSNDAFNMIKAAPQVLNQSRDIMEKKIDFLVNNIGFPVETLLEFPHYLSYNMERTKLRFLMYKWLEDEGKVRPKMALSTILAYSDKVFTLRFVNRHPEGPEVWEKFKALC